jgi:hypothetical protein
MEEWKKLICRGNRSFEDGRLDDAQMIYQAALSEADQRLGRCAARCDCDYLEALAAVAALVVTHHNLADLCVRADRIEDAAGHLVAVHDRLSHLIEDRHAPCALRAAAVRNSGRTRRAMLSFADEHDVPGPTCAIDRRITHMPANPVLH